MARNASASMLDGPTLQEGQSGRRRSPTRTIRRDGSMMNSCRGRGSSRVGRFPCPRCWDEFRPEDLAVRGVNAIHADAMAVIQHAIFVCIGLLDTSSAEARELAPG
jgi:hypothetical protein